MQTSGRARARTAREALGAAPGAPSLRERFSRFARRVAAASGSAWVFGLAVLYVLTWLGGGLLVGFTDHWQLWLNTVATFVTFLMVFLIQNAQNRHTQVLQLKLDELLAAHAEASNLLIDLEDLPEEDIERLRARYQRLADECARRQRRRGVVSADTPSPAPLRRKDREEPA